ncbi:SMI1/KNR4 family protein [Luteimicrobium subarcticum]|uniref:Knr4/Smi1-like domain-containing protein n=1 Tax=Luteimicrobium subarcticum TaxID=620910 RepID=A0A2M8W7A5_9MICO|nr:SMI1/KNR4 family protein [Luteimicrobium subarcticum]PJI86772.1 hypothetical protein CLV34_2695 [Luteimicrobium subarcticum]
MASVEDLIAAAGLTGDFELDWERAEATLGARIPDDFRHLLGAGGAGAWFDYVRLYPPDENFGDQNLLDSVGAFEDLKILWEGEISTPPDDLAPESRLIAWADTAAGETLFWRVDPGVEPTAYPIYVENADGDAWERYDLSVADFLAGISRGEVRSAFFAEAYLDVSRTFRPYAR